MSLASTVITGIGYRLGGGITISATSDPTLAAVLQWMNETALWITGICAENDSDLGRTLGTVTTIHAHITAATKAADCSITATSHGLISSGTCEAVVKDVVGMTELNDTEYTATYSSANALTLGVASTAYTTYASGGYITKRKYTDLATTLYTPAHLRDRDGNVYNGWIVDGHDRDKLILTSESGLEGYDPVEATEPTEYYVDGSNNICFPSYPDDVYVVKIPYYTLPTALTAGTDTMPFLGLMDNVFVEAVTWRAQNRDEYDTSSELKWMSFLNERARRVIEMRKKSTVSVGV
jgi:hypothetical protein